MLTVSGILDGFILGWTANSTKTPGQPGELVNAGCSPGLGDCGITSKVPDLGQR